MSRSRLATTAALLLVALNASHEAYVQVGYNSTSTSVRSALFATEQHELVTDLNNVQEHAKYFPGWVHWVQHPLVHWAQHPL